MATRENKFIKQSRRLKEEEIEIKAQKKIIQELISHTLRYY
jgi:hypothetical protein